MKERVPWPFLISSCVCILGFFGFFFFYINVWDLTLSESSHGDGSFLNLL